MFEICLFALPWMIDPVIVDRSVLPAARSVPTCSRPAATVTQPNTVSALSKSELVDALEIARLLKRWDRATRNRSELSRSQSEEFRRRISQSFNEHSVAAAEQLVGHVKADSLTETYDWRIVEQTRKRIILEAIPRDETERLFYGSLRVSLDVIKGIPDQIAIVSRTQNTRVAWQSDQVSNDDGIQLVSFEDDVPPAPSGLLRTASTRVD